MGGVFRVTFFGWHSDRGDHVGSSSQALASSGARVGVVATRPLAEMEIRARRGRLYVTPRWYSRAALHRKILGFFFLFSTMTKQTARLFFLDGCKCNHNFFEFGVILEAFPFPTQPPPPFPLPLLLPSPPPPSTTWFCLLLLRRRCKLAAFFF